MKTIELTANQIKLLRAVVADFKTSENCTEAFYKRLTVIQEKLK